MTDLTTLFVCGTVLICLFASIRYRKWEHKEFINDRITELELENEVLSNENDRLKRETTFYSSQLKDIDE